MIDFHSHILPAIDDGASDAQESILMLTILKQQKIDQIVATPHYYGEGFTILEFLKKRDESYQILQAELLAKEFIPPKIKLGAEVYLNPDTADDPDLHKLCITGTNVILLEMPFDTWYEWQYHAIYKIIAKRKLIPVMAHVERYYKDKSDLQKIERLLSLEVNCQLNASSLFDRRLWKFAKKILNSDSTVVLGSDMHNVTVRNSKLDIAIHKIIKVFGNEKMNKINQTAERLLSSNV